MEGIFFTFQFDTAVFDGRSSPAFALISLLPQFCQMGLFSIAAAILYGGYSWRETFQAAFQHKDARRDWFASICFHLVAVVAFYIVSLRVFGDGEEIASQSAWIALWCLIGLATCLSAARFVLPTSGWLRLLAAQRKSLLVGIALGAIAFAVGEFARVLWEPLSKATFIFVQALLKPLGVIAVSDPASRTIATDEFWIRIAPSCSGLEGIGLIATFLTAYLWLFRRELRFPAAFLALPLGVLCVWVANGLRIAVLILIGHFGAPDVALGGFHSQTGSLLFATVGLGVVVASKRYWALSAPLISTRDLFSSPTAAFIMPTLVLLGASMLTGALSGSFDYLYPIRVLAVGATLFAYRRYYRGCWRCTRSWHALAFGSLAFALWLAFEVSFGTFVDAPAAFAEWNAIALVSWLAFRLIGSIVVVPIAEELAFRGFAGRRLLDADFQSVSLRRWTWASWIASSVMFGLLHGPRWPVGIAAGLIFGAVAYRRGRLGDAIIAHAVANAWIAAYVLLTGDWSMWV